MKEENRPCKFVSFEDHFKRDNKNTCSSSQLNFAYKGVFGVE